MSTKRSSCHISAKPSYIWVIASKYPDFATICLGSDLDKTLSSVESDTWLEYELHLVSYVIWTLCLIFILSEWAMYTSIYKFLACHDREMKLVLSDSAIKSRMRKNVIDPTGHAINFVVEILWL